ncbi:hypothetical protein PoMZ_01541 [Pyricularia oryzae]|uniref:Uncharacterized protein n=1 Tax=Pyricularia oryzae TaxID=318829 RepID=A0A4P7N678_PYROR|nr:hypothetical protein PoMZ_01541 [Pyricularia oryzae]
MVSDLLGMELYFHRVQPKLPQPSRHIGQQDRQPHDLVEKGCHIKELVSVGSDAKGVKGASAAARSMSIKFSLAPAAWVMRCVDAQRAAGNQTYKCMRVVKSIPSYRPMVRFLAIHDVPRQDSKYTARPAGSGQAQMVGHTLCNASTLKLKRRPRQSDLGPAGIQSAQKRWVPIFRVVIYASDVCAQADWLQTEEG